jgi:hypothetical protein
MLDKKEEKFEEKKSVKNYEMIGESEASITSND